ncbi:MAG: TauD/TfdA family dioxygenase, partial [Gammaproteobacteria bacterium]|nr:TauD/TfdA family dioxygenase [Gammaproteobacteria bacterium]
IYDVQDKGTAWGYGIRGSHTNIELVFHTDNAFAQCVPDYVGLLCRQPALSGGISRFCSLYTVHERVRQQSEQALQRLYQPMFFDRQKEHAPGAPPLTWAPWFSWKRERLHTRANTQLVRKGYQLAGTPMDGELQDALTILDSVCEDPAIWFEAPLQRGQMQYLNNHETGHYRSEFTDHEVPEHKRHLVRLWHRNQGSTAYDGDEFR